MSYTQIPGHYQAVAKTDVEPFIAEEALDIKTLLHILYSRDPILKKNQGYFAASDELSDEWGKVHFLKSYSFFPTVAPDHYGAMIEFKGKEFFIYYEEQDRLIIGHEETLYAFENKEGIEDCIDVYNFIFRPQAGEIENVNDDDPESVEKNQSLVTNDSN